jgi:hypothetical protein
MFIYHRTASAASILAHGFDNSTHPVTLVLERPGVFFSTVPLDCNEGCKGDQVLRLDVPEHLFTDWEITMEGSLYREALIPAHLVNAYPPTLLTEAEVWELEAHDPRFLAPRKAPQ